MNPEQTILDIATLHRDAIVHWKSNPINTTESGFLALVQSNHAYNYQLWHEEDKARRDDMGFEFVYTAKRNIDHFNQQRNNLMELIDQHLCQQLQPADPNLTTCPIHSETPGMIIDRLSILSLKHYHMKQQTLREDVDSTHRESCHHKLTIISQQKEQLLQCLHVFLQEIIHQKRTFRLYHQLKMYNDKQLNPELYAKHRTETTTE
jgi:hypothetical protein